MRVVITEDIIRNALNESIDEFMINEGFGDAIKGAWNGLKTAGHWAKNAAAAWMNKKTHGQWNKKYGIYVDGNDKGAETYYIGQWLSWHLGQIKSIAVSGPNRNYNNIEQYVQKNINPDNFNNWAGQRIQNRQGLECIDKYIQDCADNINDIKSAEKWLNVWSFIGSDWGKQYLELTGSKLTDARQQHQQGVQAKQDAQQQRFIDAQKRQIEHIKERITDCQDFVSNLNIYNNGRVRMNGANVHWVRWAEETINSLNDIPKETKQWMDEVIARSVNKGPKYAASFLTYNNFISSPYGTKYAQLEQQINGAQQQTQQGQQP